MNQPEHRPPPRRTAPMYTTVYILYVHKGTLATQCTYTAVYIALAPTKPPLGTHGCPLTTLVKDKLFTGHLLESARETLFKTLANVGRN